jgi:hypothetical protein
MNLILTFVHPSKPAKSVGPFRAIRLDGDSVREVMNRTLVARHSEHQWEVGGERYFRLDATTRVHIHFERPPQGSASRQFGPYERFSAVDGIAYTDDRVFAFVDSKVGDWFCYNDGQHWPVMVVSDATPGADHGRLASIAALAPLAAGVIGLWKGGQLLYLGRAQSIRGRLLAIAGEDRPEVDAVTWEAHGDPAAREAELLAEYAGGARSLTQTYGRWHGNRVRTFRLLELAAAARTLARSLREQAALLRTVAAA